MHVAYQVAIRLEPETPRSPDDVICEFYEPYFLIIWLTVCLIWSGINVTPATRRSLISIFSAHHELQRDRQNIIRQVAGLWIVNYGCVNRSLRFKLRRYSHGSVSAYESDSNREQQRGFRRTWVRVKDHSALIICCDNPSCLSRGGKRETQMTRGSPARSWPLLNPSKSLICTLIPYFIDTEGVFVIWSTVLHTRRSEQGLVCLRSCSVTLARVLIRSNTTEPGSVSVFTRYCDVWAVHVISVYSFPLMHTHTHGTPLISPLMISQNGLSTQMLFHQVAWCSICYHPLVLFFNYLQQGRLFVGWFDSKQHCTKTTDRLPRNTVEGCGMGQGRTQYI